MSSLTAWMEAMDVLGWEQVLLVILPITLVSVMLILWVVLIVRHFIMKKREKDENGL